MGGSFHFAERPGKMTGHRLGHPMRTAQQVYAMLENESLWQTASHCHKLLADANIPHAVMGGVAVCMHGYQRNTTDLDLLIRREDSDAVRATLEANAFVWDAKAKEFRSPADIMVQFLLA